MNVCMDVLRAIAAIRTPFLDAVFSLITRLGEETLFTALALLFFWCVDKRKGYFLLCTGLIGTVINQWLKIVCCIPRPWLLDPKFQIVESARAEAGGFSFPSGHTQSAGGIGFSVARMYGKRWLTVLCVVLVLLTGFSRMYLGVHTPLDVVVSLAVSLLLVLLLYYPMLRSQDDRALPIILGAQIVLSVGFLCYICFAPLKVPMDNENVISGMKTTYVLLGTTVGCFAVYFFERRFVNFKTSALWWAQVLKLAVGLALVLAVKGALKAPLLELLNGSGLSHSIRYFVAFFIGGAVYPMLFRFLPGYGAEKQD